MAHVIKAALLYLAVVFGFGFIFGTIRTIVRMFAPSVSLLAAVLIEVPLLLFISWLVARWCLKQFSLNGQPSQTLTMGAMAFVLLQIAETGFSGLIGPLLFWENVAFYFSYAATPARLIGLLGQVIFALLPYFLSVRSIDERS